MSVHSAKKSEMKRLDDISQSVTQNLESQEHQTIISSKTGCEDLREAIIDLYLDVKIRSSDEIDNYDTDQFQ